MFSTECQSIGQSDGVFSCHWGHINSPNFKKPRLNQNKLIILRKGCKSRNPLGKLHYRLNGSQHLSGQNRKERNPYSLIVFLQILFKTNKNMPSNFMLNEPSHPQHHCPTRHLLLSKDVFNNFKEAWQKCKTSEWQRSSSTRMHVLKELFTKVSLRGAMSRTLSWV